VRFFAVDENTSRFFRLSTPVLDKDLYRTKVITFSIGRTELIKGIKPTLDEFWQQFSREDGTPNISEGTWVGGRITIDRETLLKEGDT
jgi:hypothetical protein